MQVAVIGFPVAPRGVRYMWARFANCSRRGLQKKLQRWLYGKHWRVLWREFGKEL